MFESITLIPLLENKLLTLNIFINISKAFNRINHDSLLKKLTNYGLRAIALELKVILNTDSSMYI